MEDRCVCCGAIIPEGRQVCPNCERIVEGDTTMKTMDATEIAYKNGYEQGKKDAMASIVHCKDCKHWDEHHCSVGYGWCSKIASYTEGTWFCADRERKDNEKL